MTVSHISSATLSDSLAVNIVHTYKCFFLLIRNRWTVATRFDSILITGKADFLIYFPTRFPAVPQKSRVLDDNKHVSSPHQLQESLLFQSDQLHQIDPTSTTLAARLSHAIINSLVALIVGMPGRVASSWCCYAQFEEFEVKFSSSSSSSSRRCDLLLFGTRLSYNN